MQREYYMLDIMFREQADSFAAAGMAAPWKELTCARLDLDGRLVWAGGYLPSVTQGRTIARAIYYLSGEADAESVEIQPDGYASTFRVRRANEGDWKTKNGSSI